MIQDLEVYAYHGVHKEEKELGQMFLVSVEIQADLENAAKTDDILKTIHYGQVCRDIEKGMASSNFDLIETAAYNIIIKIFEKYPIASKVKVILKKPWAPMGKHLKYVAVEIERAREDIYGTKK
ncbi:MAG: dihydroneopterin aldolase [Clostridiales bacterium]|nr:dihydroneopterin aldolase [Clostridiales bacterium]